MRPFKLLLQVLAGLIALFVVGSVAAYFLLDLDGVVNAKVREQLPALSEKLGREVAVEQVTTSFLPVLGATLRGVSIAGDPADPADDRRPFLRVDEVGLRVGLLDAILSGGSKVSIHTIHLDGLTLEVTRRADGSLAHQDLLERLAKSPADERSGAEAEPLDPAIAKLLKNTVIDFLGVRRGTIRFEDRQVAGEPVVAEIRELNLSLRDLQVGRPIGVSLDLAAFSDATNLWLRAELAPIPPDLQVDPAQLVRTVHLKAEAVELAALAPYLGEALPVPLESMRLSSDYEIGPLDPSKAIHLKGFVELANARFRAGEPFTLRLDQDTTIDLPKERIRLGKIDLSIGEVKLTASGELVGFGSGAEGISFRDLVLRSDTLDPSKLARYYPGLVLPAQITGDILLDVQASGSGATQNARVKVDLTGTRVFAPGSLDKPVGVPARVVLAAVIDSTKAQLSELDVRLGELQIGGQVEIADYKSESPKTTIELASNSFPFGPMARLLPAVRDLPAGTAVDGVGSMKLRFDAVGETSLAFDADLSLIGLSMRTRDTTLEGDVRLSAQLSGSAAGKLSLKAILDANTATLIVPDLLHKRAGEPLGLRLLADREGAKLDVKEFEARLGALSLEAKGTLDPAAGQTKLRVALPTIDLLALARTVPGIAKSGLTAGTLRGELFLEGDPAQLQTLQLALRNFEFTSGRNLARGDLTLQNPSAPTVVATLELPRFHLDEIFPPSKEEKARRADRRQEKPLLKPPCPPPNELLRTLDARATIRMADGRIADFPIRNFSGEVRLSEGIARVDHFSLETYGGKVEGKDTIVDLASCVGAYRASLEVRGIELGALLAEQTNLGAAISGRASGAVKLSGKGLDPYYQRKSDPDGRLLTGSLVGEIEDGRYSALQLTGALEGSLGQLLAARAPKDDGHFANIAGKVRIREGRFHLEEPMQLTEGATKTELTGSIGMDKTLALKGIHTLEGAALASLSGGKCKGSAPLAIPVSIAGTVKQPKVTAVDAGAISRALAKACLGKELEAVKETAERKVEEVKAKAKAELKEAKARAERELDERKVEAERLAREKKAAAEAKVREEKAKAEKRAKEQAKQKAGKAGKKALDRLGF